mgnify:CR=1 FL=1
MELPARCIAMSGAPVAEVWLVAAPEPKAGGLQTSQQPASYQASKLNWSPFHCWPSRLKLGARRFFILESGSLAQSARLFVDMSHLYCIHAGADHQVGREERRAAMNHELEFALEACSLPGERSSSRSGSCLGRRVGRFRFEARGASAFGAQIRAGAAGSSGPGLRLAANWPTWRAFSQCVAGRRH